MSLATTQSAQYLSRQSPRTMDPQANLVNAERYITEELKEYENKILGEDKSNRSEICFYQNLINYKMI